MAEEQDDDDKVMLPDDGKPISGGDLFKAVGDVSKVPTGMPGLDYVMDGGLPRLGGTFLTAAPAGTGKSSLVVAIEKCYSDRGEEALHISSEQPLTNLAQQFHRYGKFSSTHQFFLYLTDFDEIVETLEQTEAKIAVVDSIHRVSNVTDDEGFPLSAGHAAAVTRVASELKRLADEKQMVLFLIAHMTNDEVVKGGTGARHMCDATLTVEYFIDENDPRRIVRFEGKNRFGPVGRRALFEMTPRGFEDRGPFHGQQEPEVLEASPSRKTRTRFPN